MVGAGEDRSRRRKRVIAKFARARLEQYARLIGRERRKRIFAATRRLENVAAVNFVALQVACFSRDPEFVLGAI